MNEIPQDTAALQARIGYTFSDQTLLRLALTHSSYANEMGIREHHLHCNERLEFLGDSILSVVVSEALYRTYPDKPEGELTRLRSDSVCENALAKYAVQIGLGEYLYLGIGEEKNDGRSRKSLLADAFEALLAAMWLDAGSKEGLEIVTRFLLPLATAQWQEAMAGGRDCKTRLQQFIQQTGNDLLEYTEVGESGPDHCKVFRVEARLGANVIGRGSGRSKKEAEQNAAHDALRLFGVL